MVENTRIAQFTDLHIPTSAPNDPDLLLLEEAMTQAVQEWGAEAILLTGDLVQRGNVGSFESLDAMFQKLPVPVIPTLGNHDEKVGFIEQFSTYLDEMVEHPVAPSSFIGTRRHRGTLYVVLDLNVEDDGNGTFDEFQHQWLRNTVESTDADEVFVLIHHPTFGSPLRSLERPTMSGAADLLRTVSEFPKIRAILTGHYHHTGASVAGGAMIWAGPAFCWETDLRSADVTNRLPRRAWTLIRSNPEMMTFTPIPVE